MMNPIRVPGHKPQSCFMMCVIEPGSGNTVSCLGHKRKTFVAFHADDGDTPICCASQTNNFLGGISNL
jgi:hypothetical protein